METHQLAELIKDPVWRLSHGFYTIRNEQGKPQKFIPNEEQKEVLQEIYIHGSSIIIIIKARQLGMSTLIALVILDTLLFGTSVECNLTDYNSINAKKKLREKILYAYDRLQPEFRAQYVVYARSLQKGEFSIGPVVPPQGQSADEKPYSVFIAGETARGGTFQISWFSEWWETAARHPQRSEDILTAGWPAGEQGLRIVETTVHGGQHGEVWSLTKQGLDFHGEPLARHLRTRSTPAIMFFPWWKKDAYREEGSPSLIRQDMHVYFAKMERETKHRFDDAQKLWYQIQSDTFGVFVKGQYPTTIHECWEAPVKGAIWAEALAKAVQDQRVSSVPHDPDLEVDTTWDLGAPENTRACFWQHRSGERCMIDYYTDQKHDLPDRVRWLKATGYRYGTHYLPHDGAAREKNGISYQRQFEEELKRQGVGGRVISIKRTTDFWKGISHFNYLLATSLRIDEVKCRAWLESARLYRRKAETHNPEQFTNDIEGGNQNHGADAARMLAEAEQAEHLPHTSSGVMNNTYFDPAMLQLAITAAVEHRPTLWRLDRLQGDWRLLTASADPQGWLRKWEDPQEGQSYLVGVVNGAVVCWKASGWNGQQGKAAPAVLVAASVDEPGVNRDRLLEWAALLANHYGMCPVAVDVVTLPGGVERLVEHGCAVLDREQPMEDRRVGAGQIQRKRGHEITPDNRLLMLSTMQETWRDGLLAIWDPGTLRQMGGIITGRDDHDPVLADPGQKEYWVLASALTLQQIGRATPLRVAAPRQFGSNRAGYSGPGMQNRPNRRPISA